MTSEPTYLVYSTDDPPYADKPGEAEPIGRGHIEFDGDPAANCTDAARQLDSGSDPSVARFKDTAGRS